MSVNLATVDYSRGTGLIANSNNITIGAGISLVRVSAVIIAESGPDTYLFSRLRRVRSGSPTIEFTSQLGRFASGFVSNSHPPFVLPVQEGDIIDIRVDIGSGSSSLQPSRPQWLQVESIG